MQSRTLEMVFEKGASGVDACYGGDAETFVSAGDVMIYEPNETHGMRASDHELILLATIAPRPGARAPAVAVDHRVKSRARASA